MGGDNREVSHQYEYDNEHVIFFQIIKCYSICKRKMPHISKQLNKNHVRLERHELV
jgi:hypothetical protein